jgi:hypothetical protein
MWHLLEVEEKTIFDIADDTGYKAGYIDDVRTGRKPINDKFRFKVAKAYPSLTEFMIHGHPPELPESKSFFVKLWQLTGEDLETIAARTGYKHGYVRRMFNGSIAITDEFRTAVSNTYFPSLVAAIKELS